MDAKKVQHKCGNGDQRRDVVLIERMAIEQAEFSHGGGRLFCRNALETNDGRGPGPKFDHFIINAFELPGVAAGGLTKGVQMFEGGRGDGQFFVPGVDFVQGEPVALNFLFGAVAWLGVAGDERTEAVGSDGDALDALEDSVLWMSAISRRVLSIWGEWRVNNSCLPLASATSLSNHAVLMGRVWLRRRWSRNEFIKSRCGHRISKPGAGNEKSGDGNHL